MSASEVIEGASGGRSARMSSRSSQYDSKLRGEALTLAESGCSSPREMRPYTCKLGKLDVIPPLDLRCPRVRNSGQWAIANKLDEPGGAGVDAH